MPRNCKNGCVGNPNRMRLQPQPLARPVASLIRPETSYDLAHSFNSWGLPPAPEPVRFPRKALQMKFAVLLMRSAYESVDALDFIPMDKFQEKLYFDFISFAQFATISNQMRTGEMMFKERIGSDGAVQVVKRDDRLKNNTKLPSAFRSHAGNAIYQKLLEGFEGQGFSVPPPCPQRSSFFCVRTSKLDLETVNSFPLFLSLRNKSSTLAKAGICTNRRPKRELYRSLGEGASVVGTGHPPTVVSDEGRC